MFEVGFTEIVLILGLALLVLGPEKLPGLAQKVGRWTGRARSMARQLRTQLEQEVTLDELSKSRPQTSTPSADPSTHTPDSHDPLAGTGFSGTPDYASATPEPPAHPEQETGNDLDQPVPDIDPAQTPDTPSETKNVS